MITAIVAGAVAVVLIVLLRRAARRDDAPAWVTLSGTVPAAATWLPAALNALAGELGGRSSWRDLDADGVLSGHRAEVRLPYREEGREAGPGAVWVLIAVELQPHTAPDALPAGGRLRVRVSVVDGPPRRGWRRLLLGRGPAEGVLVLRRRVQAALHDAALAAGATARLPARPPVRALLVGGAVVLALVAGSAAVPPAVEFLREQATRTPAPVRAQPPDAARRCSPKGGSATHPTRSAVNSRNACPFAEAVRTRYLAVDPGRREQFRVKSPSTGETSTVRCAGSDLITCRRGDLRIYLYSPS